MSNMEVEFERWFSDLVVEARSDRHMMYLIHDIKPYLKRAFNLGNVYGYRNGYRDATKLVDKLGAGEKVIDDSTN